MKGYPRAFLSESKQKTTHESIHCLFGFVLEHKQRTTNQAKTSCFYYSGKSV
jgi:hypothetical protein